MPAKRARALPEQEWPARIRAGDVLAFERLFEAYAAPLARFLRVYLGSAEEAEEVVQDLFCWIWENRERWEVDESLKAYLYRAARNRATSRLRRRRLVLLFRKRVEERQDLPRSPASSAPDAQLLEGELHDQAAAALAAMPPRCREVFELCRTHRMTYGEVGTVLGVSPRTVEVHMSRALRYMREALRDWLGGG